MPKPTTFAARLHLARTRAGLSVADLAERAGVHVDTIYKLLREDDRDPQLSVATRLASALGVSVAVLAGEKA